MAGTVKAVCGARTRYPLALVALVAIALLSVLPSHASGYGRPSRPVRVTAASVGHAKYRLRWPDVRGAARYRVYNNGVLVGRPRRSSFTTNALLRPGTHLYAVRSESRIGTLSLLPRWVAIRVPPPAPPVSHDTTPPGVPSLSVADPQHAAPRLSWRAVADRGGSGLAGYRVYRDGQHIASTAGTSFVDAGGESGGHTYTVSSYDRAGNISAPSAPKEVGQDTTAPPTPVTATPVSPTEHAPVLAWSAVRDTGSGVAQYDVSRDGTQIGSTHGLTFADNDLAEPGPHDYAVRAVDHAGNSSDWSAPVSIDFEPPAPDTTPPDTPVATAAASPTTTAPRITWAAVSDVGSGVASYRISRDGIQIDTTTSLGYTDSSVVLPGVHQYAVRAVDRAGNVSDWSAAVLIDFEPPALDTTAPSDPANLAVSISGSSAVVSWDASTDDTAVTGYDVYAGGAKVGTETGTSHTFHVSCGTTYTFGVIAFDAAGNRSAMSTVGATTDACSSGSGFDVTNYGARADGTTNDSAAFGRAIAAASAAGSASNPGIVYVPAGHYSLANVALRSNVTVQVQAGTVFTVNGSATSNMPIFYLGSYANGGASWVDNVAVTGVGGSFTVDMSHVPTAKAHGFTVQNARHFEISNVIGIQNDSSLSGNLPSSQAALITFHSTSSSGGYHPVDGLISNISVTHSPYGYGATQVTAGESLTFQHISSQGGIALRLETDGNSDTLTGVTASDITCRNGHAALSFSPHDQINGSVHVTSVSSVGCSEGIRVAGNPTTGDGGKFVGATVSGATIVAGPFAQNPSGTLGAWRIGQSDTCTSISGTAAYTVAMSGITCQGF